MSRTIGTDACERTITACGDQVVLRVVPESEQRPSGIILPQGRRPNYKAPIEAEIVDCGEAVPATITPGRTALVLALADGVRIKIAGEQFWIVSHKAIVGILGEPRPRAAIEANISRLIEELREGHDVVTHVVYA